MSGTNKIIDHGVNSIRIKTLVFYAWLVCWLLALVWAASHAFTMGVTGRSLFVSGVALAVSAGLLLLAKRARDWCWAAMICGTAVYLAAYVAQEYILHSTPELYVINRDNPEWDFRSKGEVIADLNAEGVSALPKISYGHGVFDAEGGTLINGQLVSSESIPRRIRGKSRVPVDLPTRQARQWWAECPNCNEFGQDHLDGGWAG